MSRPRSQLRRFPHKKIHCTQLEQHWKLLHSHWNRSLGRLGDAVVTVATEDAQVIVEIGALFPVVLIPAPFVLPVRESTLFPLTVTFWPLVIAAPPLYCGIILFVILPPVTPKSNVIPPPVLLVPPDK